MSPSELIGPAELLGRAVSQITHAFQTPTGIIAYAAAAIAIVLMVVSSFVKTMVPLRWLAVGSNLGFAVFWRA